MAANNAPILISSGTINTLADDKMPVGHGENKNQLGSHTIQIKYRDSLYLHTDGHDDLLVGPKGKKFKYKELDELLLKNSHKPIKEQCLLLDIVFEN